MQLNIVNLTGSTRTYLSGAISVAGNSSTSVTNTIQQLALATDGSLKSDIFANLAQITDGTNTYGTGDAIAYLQLIPLVLGPKTPGASYSYAGTTTTFTPGSTVPTDLVTLTGNGTKTIRLLRMVMTYSDSAKTNTWFLIKRSTQDSGGTPSTITTLPLDSSNPAATATMKTQALPSLGSAIGNLQVVSLFTATSSATIFTYDFTNGGTTQGVVLRGTEMFALNYNGATRSWTNLSVTLEWTEE